MVRVISVHHFANQHILTVEQPTASTIAPPNRLLLALSSHCIEVRDLKSDGDVLFTFPTVDEVIKLLHCLNGDYVATLETKFNRQNRELNFVRVYVNWDSVATLQQSKMTSSGVSLGLSECGMVQPMRARIAGRVTPTTNQSELGSLEMIEIPMKQNPNSIEVCQISGNILILSKKSVTFYKFEVKYHVISKLRFIDFEELPINITLSFRPTQLAICENYLACLNKDSMHMFKWTIHTDSNNTVIDSNSYENCSVGFKYNQGETIDYKKLLRDERLNLTTEPVTVNFPSIVRQNSAIHKYNPFTFCDKHLTPIIKSTSAIKSKPQYFQIENLIQLKLKPIMIENAQKQVSEEFKYLILKPLYVDETINKSTHKTDRNNLLESSFRNSLNSVSCLIATQQEGYLYQFSDAETSRNLDNCITVYPFTSPVYKIIMEDNFLHALTETGLESYSMRVGHQLCRNLEKIDNLHVACPPVSDSICLVGLRPFLGIEQILLADNHLVLLANSETSPTHSIGSNSSSTTSYWTMYNLELPTPKIIFNDISIVANVHRFTSAQTYCHLIGEAHIILRLSLILNKWEKIDGTVTLIKPKRNNTEDIYEAYRTSCALLADHYIMCATEKEYRLAVPYYKMAAVLPYDVITRVKKLQEQSNNHQAKGLIFYLKTVLFDVKLGSDLFNSCSKQNFAEAVLELFERHNFQDLPNLILKVNILREYGTNKLINVLNNGPTSLDTNQTEKMLALTVLYILQSNRKKAQKILQEINKDSLYGVLLENWELLFEKESSRRGRLSFTELTIILMNEDPEILSELILVYITEKKVFSLNKLLKSFLHYLPSSIGTDSNQASLVLQKTLELYFKYFFQKYENQELTKIVYDGPTHEALKLLVRSYLSQLQILQMKSKSSENTSNGAKKCVETNGTPTDPAQEAPPEKFKYHTVNKTNFGDKKASIGETYLFSRLRHDYLNKMPPFQVEIISNLYNEDAKKKHKPPKNEEADLVLKKLQSLLCSQIVPNQVILEINAFLTLNENLRGCLSLQASVMNVNDGILFLIEACPQCILQYGKDRFTKPDEWKFLIATIQRRIICVSQNDELARVCFFYKKLLKDVLSHVATTMNLEQLMLVFPQHMNYSTSYIDDTSASQPEIVDENTLLTSEETTDNIDILNEIQDYDSFITLCKETMHANQIKKLITATGQQLLCTLNL